ncbi:MAG: ABC transporter ATP-binding protein, partial [Bacteroidota bacterium]
PTDIWEYLGLIALASLLYYVALEGARLLLYLVGEKTGLALHLKALAATRHARFAEDTSVNTGQRLKHITRGSASLNQFFRLYANVGLDTVISLTGIIIIFASLNIWLILFLAIFFTGQFFLGRHMTQRGSTLAEIANNEADILMGQSFEWLQNLRTVRALHAHQPLLKRMQRQRQILTEALKRRVRTFRIRLGLLGFNQQLFRLLMLAFCVWQVVKGHFEVGIIAQVYFYFGKIEFTARQFSDLYHKLILIRIDLKTILPLLEPASQPAPPYTAYPDSWKKLHISGLAFQYGEKALFQDFNLEIYRGEKIGIAGPSGSGKSSLLALMLGLRRPTSGQILLDSHPVHEVSSEAWGQHCAIVMQETELFEMSVRENISLGTQGEPDPAKMEYVIGLASLSERIAQLPKGLNTALRGPDYGLSGGERQRMGLARALYRSPDILLLDEVSAHLDAQAEADILKSLQRLPVDMTLIMVAHRLTMLRHMDRILVMEEGKIVQSGPFDELLQQEGLFATLWAAANQA